MITIMLLTLEQYFAENGAVSRDLTAGEALFRRGDEVGSMFVVSVGVIELVRNSPGGGVLVLQRAKGGEVLAEASLYSRRYHCDGVAGVASTVAALSIGDFRRLFETNSQFALLWSRHLARQVQAARYRSEILTRKTVAERLDGWLSWHEEGLPQKGEWAGLAAQIGVSPEALYRELARRR